MTLLYDWARGLLFLLTLAGLVLFLAGAAWGLQALLGPVCSLTPLAGLGWLAGGMAAALLGTLVVFRVFDQLICRRFPGEKRSASLADYYPFL